MGVTTNSKKKNPLPTIAQGSGQLTKYLQKYGTLPPVTLAIAPLEQNNSGAAGTGAGLNQIYIDEFISYNFAQSILTPVSAFQCEMFFDYDTQPQPGDIMTLYANGQSIAVGIIDQTDFETDKNGTRLTIQGRDLLGQWEDQDAVNPGSDIYWQNKATILQIVNTLAKNTRVNPNNMLTPMAPTQPYMFATQPGESKISAFQRYCEALDIYFWMDGNGNLNVGRPNMYGASVSGNPSYSVGVQDRIYCNQNPRGSNVLSIRSTRNTTQIPNLVLPIWNGQETVQARVSKSQCIRNSSEGPARLYQLGHITQKAVIVSTPDGASPQDLSELNTLLVAGQKQNSQSLTQAGANTILQSYAKRMIARANVRELNVQISVPGHFNTQAAPYVVNSLYHIEYDADDVDEDMFLYEVDYTLTEEEGPRTRLNFCRQTALVSNVRAL